MAQIGQAVYNGLIAGDYPTKTEAITITGPISFKRGDVVGIRDEDQFITLVDSTQTDGTQKPIGIICDDITLEDGEMAQSMMYVKGEFSERFLQFGGDDTVDTHRRYMTQIGLLIRATQIEGGAY